MHTYSSETLDRIIIKRMQHIHYSLNITQAGEMKKTMETTTKVLSKRLFFQHKKPCEDVSIEGHI